ncbi:MAG TPA: hypothetical protein VN803_15445 [Gemmatimonadales bacterium]|nr:hypothetical protein [Gemmatimonadales bacterium]
MIRPLFVVHPGRVISRNDGDKHYVGVAQLVELYGLRRGEYIVDHGDGVRGADTTKLNHLFPMSGPDYRPVTDRERESVVAALDSPLRGRSVLTALAFFDHEVTPQQEGQHGSAG